MFVGTAALVIVKFRRYTFIAQSAQYHFLMRRISRRSQRVAERNPTQPSPHQSSPTHQSYPYSATQSKHLLVNSDHTRLSDNSRSLENGIVSVPTVHLLRMRINNLRLIATLKEIDELLTTSQPFPADEKILSCSSHRPNIDDVKIYETTILAAQALRNIRCRNI